MLLWCGKKLFQFQWCMRISIESESPEFSEYQSSLRRFSKRKNHLDSQFFFGTKNTHKPPKKKHNRWCVKSPNSNPKPSLKKTDASWAGPTPSTPLEPLTLPRTLAPFVAVVESCKVPVSRSYYHNFEKTVKKHPLVAGILKEKNMWRKWQNLKTLDTKGYCKNLNFEIVHPSCNFEMSQPVFH